MHIYPGLQQKPALPHSWKPKTQGLQYVLDQRVVVSDSKTWEVAFFENAQGVPSMPAAGGWASKVDSIKDLSEREKCTEI